MDQPSLVPPSHFTPDSLETTPKNTYNQSSRDQSITATPRNIDPVLKTPDDFKVPISHLSVPSQLVYSEGVSPTILKPTQVSQHICDTSTVHNSGYNWKRVQNEPLMVKEDVLRLFNELKEENKRLVADMKNSSSKGDSGANIDVITHQVQFIERLQKDSSMLSDKLMYREEELMKLERMNHEKELSIKQQNTQLLTSKEQLNKESIENMKLCQNVASLKKEVNVLEEEKQQLCEMHNQNIETLKQKHEIEFKANEEMHNTLKKEMEANLEKERKCWKENEEHMKNEWEKKCQNVVVDYEAKILSNEAKQEGKKKEMVSNQHGLQEKLNKAEEATEKLREENEDKKIQLQDMEHCLQKSRKDMKVLQQQFNEEKVAAVNLKTYISRIQSNDHAKEQWKIEKGHFMDKVQKLDDEKVELIKTVEVLNIRFNSISKILEMQEQAISAHTAAIPDVHSQRKAAVVTSQWRQKVFELMVQRKTLEIVIKEDSRKCQSAINNLTTQLEDQTRECDILTNRLKDATAQLDLKGHITRSLESNNQRLQEELKTANCHLEEQNASLLKLRDVVSCMSKSCSQMCEDNLTKCLERCLRLEQRLTFANNRLRTVQDLLQRRDTMWRIRLQQVSQSKDLPPTAETKEENSDLVAEVLHLTEERDSLSQQLAQDATKFEKVIASMKANEETYQQMNQKLEKQGIEYEKKISEHSKVIERLKEQIEDQKYEKKTILEELEKSKESVAQVVDAAIEEVKLQQLNELKEKETCMNQVKRELTKTVVALRQSERGSVRERNQFKEQLELERTSWLNEEQQFRNHIVQLQKDNNLLMTTLRQEGIMSVFKAARGKPITQDDERAQKHVQFSLSPSNKATPQETCSKESDVNKMLQDLTNLSKSVLADSESD